MAYVYLLKSVKDGKRYIGSTTDLKRRLQQHNSGQVHSTKYRRPLILLGYQLCSSIKEAALLEKKYKSSHDFLNRMIKLGRLKSIGV